jgi:hypothetical protein
LRKAERPALDRSWQTSLGLITNSRCLGRNGVEMAKKPTAKSEFVLFDVLYEDGSRRSNRRVPGELLGGLDGDEPARMVIEQQDRDIAEKSGQPPLRIKSLQRSGSKK